MCFVLPWSTLLAVACLLSASCCACCNSQPSAGMFSSRSSIHTRCPCTRTHRERVCVQAAMNFYCILVQTRVTLYTRFDLRQKSNLMFPEYFYYSLISCWRLRKRRICSTCTETQTCWETEQTGNQPAQQVKNPPKYLTNSNTACVGLCRFDQLNICFSEAFVSTMKRPIERCHLATSE